MAGRLYRYTSSTPGAVLLLTLGLRSIEPRFLFGLVQSYLLGSTSLLLLLGLRHLPSPHRGQIGTERILPLIDLAAFPYFILTTLSYDLEVPIYTCCAWPRLFRYAGLQSDPSINLVAFMRYIHRLVYAQLSPTLLVIL